MASSSLFTKDKEFMEQTISIAHSSLEFLQMLDDVPQIASEVTSLMLELTKIDGFTETEQVISTILEKATQMRESFSKDPFVSFNEIIAEGPADAVANAFPDVTELYQQASSSPQLDWLADELVETIQVYCYRKEFAEGVTGELQTLVPMFMQSISNGKENALIPLAALAKASHAQFAPF